MNQTAKELREAADYMKREGVDLLGAVIRLNNTFDAINPGTPAANLGAIIAHIADELDELDDKAARRRSHIVKLESTIAERNRELRELRGQVPSERERQILDMWPRFEDGEPVWFGDEMNEVCGKVSGVYFDDDAIGIYARGSDHLHLSVGERVKRPVQSVPDADGVEIKVGDTVWLIPACAIEPDEPYEVTGINKYGEVMLEFHVEGSTGVKGEYLTHTRPDSWERLEEDTAKNLCEYFGFMYRPCNAGEGCPAYEQGNCTMYKAKDIIRRAKALAGIEVE